MSEGAKAAYRAIMAIDDETPCLVRFVLRSIGERKNPQVVDVGCGYGRTLRALQEAGVQAVGVDVNPQIVTANKDVGFACVTPTEFEKQALMADVLVMSHVVEHFAPRDLMAFFDTYLARLHAGGHLIIATPLLGDRFFDDFDHVKPYQPVGLAMIFGGGKAQVQYYSQYRMQLEDVWFRRSAYAQSFARGLYVKSWTTPLLQALNLGGALLYRLSGGRIGRVSGWVGVFRKLEGENQNLSPGKAGASGGRVPG